jgi:hypothetical protein
VAARGDGPLPGEPEVYPIEDPPPPPPPDPPLPPEERGEIPLAPAPPKAPPPAILRPKPKLQDAPLWPVPEELTGRRWLVAMTLVAMLGLYSYWLSSFYAGAHDGVDQAGYLMTARLIAGVGNVGNPDAVAVPVAPPPATAPAGAPHTAPGVKSADAKSSPAVWAGGETGYTAEHPAPQPIQTDPRFNWLRNRLSFVPSSPFEFASRMCIITEPFGPASPDLPEIPGAPATTRPARPATATRPATPGKPAEYRVFAKYPFGFPLLAAIGRDIAAAFDTHTVVYRRTSPAAPPATRPAGPPAKPATLVRAPAAGRGLDGMYLVNPVCTVLACFFAYFLFRQAVSPFVALIGVCWLACNPLVLNYANDANSHASTLFCVCAGFWGLLSFLRTRRLWRAWVGGFLLGYAATIRYSEALLLLPVAFAAVLHFRPTWRRAAGSVSLLTAWAIPVAALAFVCWISFGSPFTTGYTYCNEDTGFGWKYLSGDFGDSRVVGNWETLVTQVNRTGLFLLWPLALAGLFGMVGAAWRLGTIIALWIIPSLLLYLLYYWAPGGETATGYLRFFVTVMPGLIFAAVWILERALAALAPPDSAADSWAGLVLGTLLALFLLLVVAFYADGGPATLEGGLRTTVIGFATQAPAALWHLFTQSWTGKLAVAVTLAAIAGIWLFDRHLVPSRMGVALGAGVITALGCSINVLTILPSIENNFVRWTTFRTIVDNVREVVPPGSVIFDSENLLQQFDGVGGWKLYDNVYFSPRTLTSVKARLDNRSKPSAADDPDPISDDRSQFYVELLSTPSSASSRIAIPRSEGDIDGLRKALVDRHTAAGERVTTVTLSSPGDMPGGGTLAGRPMATDPPPAIAGYTARVLRRWRVSPAPSGPVTGGTPFSGNLPAARGGRPAARQAAAAPPPPRTTPLEGALYTLWEYVKTP